MEKRIAHYTSPDCEYSNLIVLSENAHSRLLEARQIRCELGGNNEHREQCNLIPEHVDSTVHRIHMNPCFKKFTLIISQSKRKSSNDARNLKQKRLCSSIEPLTSSQLFTDNCYFCKSKRKKIHSKEQVSHKLTLSSSEDSIKATVEEKCDKDVLRDTQGVDLLAEFQVHDKCRIDYIRKSSVSDTYVDISEKNWEI